MSDDYESDYDGAPPARLTEEQLQRALARSRAKHCCHGSCSEECRSAYWDEEAAWMFDDHLWHQQWSEDAKERRASGDHEGWMQALASTYRLGGLATPPAPVAPAAPPKRGRAPKSTKAPTGKRKSLGKALRFEVLKRDKFACQYCGAKAPDVLLQVDHITAVANGGGDSILNLITSCQPCNSGKSATPLDSSTAVSKARAQAAELQKRREQIEMMAAWQTGLVDLEVQQVAAAHEVIKKMMPGWCLSESACGELRQHLSEHGLEAVLSHFRTACASWLKVDDGKITSESAGKAIEQAMSALKWKRMNEANPLNSQALYVRGILRKRLSYVHQANALNLARRALGAGADFAKLKQMAIDAYNWSEWQSDMLDLLEALGERGGG